MEINNWIDGKQVVEANWLLLSRTAGREYELVVVKQEVYQV